MLDVPNPVLQKIHADNGFTAPNGERVDLANAGALNWGFAETLYRTIRKYRPKRALEIGMASGVSALSILTALKENGDAGTLHSIDPFQSTGGRNAGRSHVEASGFAAMHSVAEEFDYIALPALLKDGHRFDFVYIDGNHDFEYVILDFFYSDLLLNAQGIIAFNDCGWRSVHAAMRHVPRPEAYVELDVGLKPDYRAKNFIVSIEKRLTGRSESDRYFQKRRRV